MRKLAKIQVNFLKIKGYTKHNVISTCHSLVALSLLYVSYKSKVIVLWASNKINNIKFMYNSLMGKVTLIINDISNYSN